MAQQVVAWNAGKPAIDFSSGASAVLTLKGNDAQLSVANGADGDELTVILKQDATGGRRFAWPAALKGGSDPSGCLAPNQTLVQKFVHDGTGVWRAVSKGVITD